MKVLVAQLCLTLCNTTYSSCQAPLSMGFFRQEYWRGLVPSLAQGWPESSALQADSSPSEPLWKPFYKVSMQISLHLFCLQFIWLLGSEDSRLSSIHHSHLSLHIVSAPLFLYFSLPGILIRHMLQVLILPPSISVSLISFTFPIFGFSVLHSM